jgi:hypothetical protein
VGVAGLALAGAVAIHNTVWARFLLVGLLACAWIGYRQALKRRTAVEHLVDALVQQLDYAAFDSKRRNFKQKKQQLVQVSTEE